MASAATPDHGGLAPSIGPLTVSGQPFNGAMPAFKDQLDDAQLAAVLTYVRSQWGNAAGPLAPDDVARVRDEHKGRSAPFAGAADLPSPSPPGTRQ